MPPNAPSNSRLPQLALWSGYGTALWSGYGTVGVKVMHCRVDAPRSNPNRAILNFFVP